MYTIPLTNAPNQTFFCNIPLNGGNKKLRFDLRYNTKAQYWMMTVTDARTNEEYITNIPLLSSNYAFRNLFNQLGYKNIGKCYIYNKAGYVYSMPDDEDLGTAFLMLWGDNDA